MFCIIWWCYVLLFMSWSMRSLRIWSLIELKWSANKLANIFFTCFCSHTLHTCLLFTLSGSIIQSTLDEEQSKTHAAALSDLSCKASYIVGMLNPDDELTFLRIRSKQREIMVCNLLYVVKDVHFLYILCMMCTYLCCHSIVHYIKISPDKEFLLVVLQNPNVLSE